jgi:glycosyltransferase involved in cell wall biosynthesis
MKNIYLAQIVNSSVGVKGNIGWRTAMILDELISRHHQLSLFCRYTTKPFRHYQKGWNEYVYISRFLNFFRIYCNRTFNSRHWDNFLFSFIERIIHSRMSYIIDGTKKKILHIWEPLPEVILRYKRESFLICLDVPIAPSRYSEYLNQHYENFYSYKKNSQLITQEESSFALADVIVVPSEFVSCVLKKYYHVPNDKIRIVPFGAPLVELKKTNKVKKIGFDFCFAGVINSRKGIPVLLEAWNDPAFQDDRLHLCGRLFPEMDDMIKKIHSGKIILPGIVEIMDYFHQCDIYVFPSLLEGSSKSIYEAMAAGLPVITTFNSGSIVRDGQDGIIVPIADPRKLRQAMLTLKADSSLRHRLGKNGKERAMEYSWQRYASSIVDLYEDL